MSKIQLTEFTTDHLDDAVGLSAAENWPHRHEDWNMVLGLSSGVAAMCDGRVVGTALRTEYGKDVAALNMIIVAEDARGQGLGRDLMAAVMDGYSQKELRLVATQAGLPLYEKLGFGRTGEIGQYQGLVTDIVRGGPGVRQATADDLGAIVDLDRQSHVADRHALLTWLLEHGVVAVATKEGGGLHGYAVLRKFGRGHVIGPVIAPTQERAQGLIAFLAARIRGEFLRVDTDLSLNLTPWLTSIGLSPNGRGIIMQKNATASPKAVFGLCSQALG